MNQKKKLFIVGVGRSGTSLLQAILASHHSIEFIPETSVLRRYLFKSKLSTILENADSSAVRTTVEKDARLQRVSHIKQAIDIALSEHDSQSNLDCCFYEAMLDHLSGEYVGDKDPKLVEYVQLLMYLWPTSKLIHIYRDPRDVLVSKKKASWSLSKSNFTQIVASISQFKMAMAASERWKSKSIYTLQYEELLQRPDEVLKHLCSWLSVPFDPNTLNHTISASKLVSNDEMQWKSDVLKPINSNNFDKWKTELTAIEIACAEYSCSAAMSLGNYTKSDNLSILIRAYATVYSLMAKMVAAAYILYRRLSNHFLVKDLH